MSLNGNGAMDRVSDAGDSSEVRLLVQVADRLRTALSVHNKSVGAIDEKVERLAAGKDTLNMFMETSQTNVTGLCEIIGRTQSCGGTPTLEEIRQQVAAFYPKEIISMIPTS